MSTTSAAFGLAASFHPSGTIRPSAYTIRSTYSSNILQNQPVKIVPSSTGEGTIAAASVGDRFIGTFQGVEWTDSDGQRRVSNKWTANTVGTQIVAYVTLDPAIEYQIQANATLDVDSIGKQYDFTAASGNTTTGFSTQMLDVASVASNASLQVVGLVPGPDNAWGDNYPIVTVRISEHQMVADVASF
jgi:hypothetical protein